MPQLHMSRRSGITPQVSLASNAQTVAPASARLQDVSVDLVAGVASADDDAEELIQNLENELRHVQLALNREDEHGTTVGDSQASQEPSAACDEPDGRREPGQPAEAASAAQDAALERIHLVPNAAANGAASGLSTEASSVKSTDASTAAYKRWLTSQDAKQAPDAASHSPVDHVHEPPSSPSPSPPHLSHSPAESRDGCVVAVDLTQTSTSEQPVTRADSCTILLSDEFGDSIGGKLTAPLRLLVGQCTAAEVGGASVDVSLSISRVGTPAGRTPRSSITQQGVSPKKASGKRFTFVSGLEQGLQGLRRQSEDENFSKAELDSDGLELGPVSVERLECKTPGPWKDLRREATQRACAREVKAKQAVESAESADAMCSRQDMVSPSSDAAVEDGDRVEGGGGDEPEPTLEQLFQPFAAEALQEKKHKSRSQARDTGELIPPPPPPRRERAPSYRGPDPREKSEELNTDVGRKPEDSERLMQDEADPCRRLDSADDVELDRGDEPTDARNERAVFTAMMLGEDSLATTVTIHDKSVSEASLELAAPQALSSQEKSECELARAPIFQRRSSANSSADELDRRQDSRITGEEGWYSRSRDPDHPLRRDDPDDGRPQESEDIAYGATYFAALKLKLLAWHEQCPEDNIGKRILMGRRVCCC